MNFEVHHLYLDTLDQNIEEMVFYFFCVDDIIIQPDTDGGLQYAVGSF